MYYNTSPEEVVEETVAMEDPEVVEVPESPKLPEPTKQMPLGLTRGSKSSPFASLIKAVEKTEKPSIPKKAKSLPKIPIVPQQKQEITEVIEERSDWSITSEEEPYSARKDDEKDSVSTITKSKSNLEISKSIEKTPSNFFIQEKSAQQIQELSDQLVLEQSKTQVLNEKLVASEGKQ